MLFFLYLTSSVSFIKRFPLHTSQVTYTVGRKCISTATNPFPWHASHLPPFTLKEKRPGPQPRARASSLIANMSRMCVHAPVYVAGFDRGVRPMGDWSIRIERPKYSVPENSAALYVLALRYRLSNRAKRFLCKISYRNVDFPEPDTPVMQTSFPSGTSTLILSRLNFEAPRIFIFPLSAVRRFSGISILVSSRKYESVREPDLLLFAVSSSSSHPEATIVPPCTPAPGPRSRSEEH